MASINVTTEKEWFKAGDTVEISGTANYHSAFQSLKVTGTDVDASLDTPTSTGSSTYAWSWTYDGDDVEDLVLTFTLKTGSGTNTDTYTLNVDTKAPEIAVAADPIKGYDDDFKVAVTATATDKNFKSMTYSIDGADAVEYTGALKIGDNCTIVFTATDLAGNVTTETYTVDSFQKKTTYAGGDSEQYDLDDNWTNYVKRPVVRALDFYEPVEGNTYDYFISDDFIGVEQAKKIKESDWTEMTDKVTISGENEKVQFVYVREKDAQGLASIKIYQLFADTVAPLDTAINEVKGEADFDTGWVNKYTSNAGVIYDAETGTYEGRTANELAKDAGYKVNVIAKDTRAVVEPEIKDVANPVNPTKNVEIRFYDYMLKDYGFVRGTGNYSHKIKAFNSSGGSVANYYGVEVTKSGSGYNANLIKELNNYNSAQRFKDGNGKLYSGKELAKLLSGGWTSVVSGIKQAIYDLAFAGDMEFTVEEIKARLNENLADEKDYIKNAANDYFDEIQQNTAGSAVFQQWITDAVTDFETQWKKLEGTSSDITVTEANGTVQKYWVNENYNGTDEIILDEEHGWKEYSQENPFKFTTEGKNVSENHYIVVEDKAGNVSEAKKMDAIDIDWTDPNYEGYAWAADTYGNNGSNGWKKSGPNDSKLAVFFSDSVSGIDTTGAADLYTKGADGEWSKVTAESVESLDPNQKGQVIYTWVNGLFNFNSTGDNLKVVFHDKAGNETEKTLSENIKIDTTLAEATITIGTADGENGWYKTTPTYSVTATDNLSGVWKIDYKIDDGEWTNIYTDSDVKTAELTVTESLSVLDTGTDSKTYKFRITDVAGNETEYTQDAIKVDTVAPDASTTTAVHIGNDAEQKITGKADEWVTDKNLVAGKGSFDLSGSFKKDSEDKGSARVVEISYEVKYQLLELVDGVRTWTTVTENSEELVGLNMDNFSYFESDFVYSAKAGTWSLTEEGQAKMQLPKDAAGIYTFTVTVKDQAGNSTDETFYVNFDNTQPLNPKVALGTMEIVAVPGPADLQPSPFIGAPKEEFVAFGEEVVNAFQKKDGLTIQVSDAQAAGDKLTETAPVTDRYWATQTGKLNLATLVFTEENKFATGTKLIKDTEFYKYWDGAVDMSKKGETMKEDAYVIAFYDKNSTGTFSTGATSEKDLTNMRFVIDSTKVNEEIVFTNGEGEDLEVVKTYDQKDKDGNVVRTWVKADADGKAAISDTVNDFWSADGAADDYADHTSNVKSAKLTVDGVEMATGAAEGDVLATEFDGVGHDFVVKTETEDNAGNKGGIEKTVALDNAGPTIGEVKIYRMNVMGMTADGEYPFVMANATDGVYYVNDNQFMLLQEGLYDSYMAGGTAEQLGAGVDLANSSYTVASNTMFGMSAPIAFEDNGMSTGKIERDDGEYTVGYLFTDNVGNVTEAAYTVVVDTVGPTQTIESGYTLTVDGGPSQYHKHPTTKNGTYTVDGDVTTFGWTNEMDFEVTFADERSGLADEFTLEGRAATWDAEKNDWVYSEWVSKTNPGTAGFGFNSEGTPSGVIGEIRITISDKAGNQTEKTYVMKIDKEIAGSVAVTVGDKVFEAGQDGTFYVNSENYSLAYEMTDDHMSDASYLYYVTAYGQENTYANVAAVKDAETGVWGWTRSGLSTDEGVAKTYDAIITDKAGNQTAVDAKVMVDQTAADKVEALSRGEVATSDNTLVYEQDGQQIDVKDWTNKDVQLKAKFNNEAGKAGEEHFVTTKFDIAAYNAAMNAGDDKLTAMKKGAEAAGGKWESIGSTTGASAALEKTFDVADHSTYYFYTIDEAGNVSDYSANEVKIDKIKATLDLVELESSKDEYRFQVNASDVGGSGVNYDTLKMTSYITGKIMVNGVAKDVVAGEVYEYVSGTTIAVNKDEIEFVPNMFAFNVNDGAGNQADTVMAGKVTIDAITLDGKTLDADEVVWSNGDGIIKIAMTGATKANKIEVWDANGDFWQTVATDSDQFGLANEKRYETLKIRVTVNGVKTVKTVKAGWDNTDPTITTKAQFLDGTKYNGEWTNKDVKVLANYSDKTSGINGRTTDDYVVSDESADANGTKVSFSTTDVAGNESTVDYIVKIDKTAQAITVIADDYVGGTWTNKDVTVSAYAEEGLSGLNTAKSDLAAKTLTKEGVNTATFKTVDNAGNVETASFDVKIDKTAADIAAKTDSMDFDNKTATVVMTATDALSGVASYRVDGGAWQTYTGVVSQIVSIAATTPDVTFEVMDNAGNVSELVFSVGNDQDIVVDKTLKFAKDEKVAFGFDTMTGTAKNETITFGANSEVIMVGNSIDLLAGTNAIKIEKNAKVTVDAELANVSTITVTAGAKVSEKVGKTTVSTQMFTAASFGDVDFAAGKAGTLSVGAYADVAAGDVTGDVAKANKIAVGANSSFEGGVIEGVQTLTVAAGTKFKRVSTDAESVQGISGLYLDNYLGTAKADKISLGNFTEAEIDSIAFGDGNDTLAIGSDSTFAAKSLDFGAGADKFTVGARSTAKVGDITGVQTLSLTAGKAPVTTKGKEAAAVYTKLEAGKVTMLADKANTVTFNNYTDVTLGNVEMGALADKLTIGNNAEIDLGDVNFGAGNDALKIGMKSTVTAKTVMFGDGKDSLNVGADSTLTIDKLDVSNLETLTLGKGATLKLGDAQDVTDAKAKWSKYADQITLA